ncbi:hypothetical protein JKF63_06237 [Porcisia hertigi]|uniref:C2 domain-containing protein n=1 Tax=Porcisia hertigi TaxID=2761500 RepID=A0A836I1A4_9TRYP|nr:hypothetical protein JKF63_06237 [Porcisia hertigi]
MVSGFLDIDILRGKNYPHTEDDPIPCTTQVAVKLVDVPSGEALSAAQRSSIQQSSNAPFYNDTLRFRVEESPESLSFVVTVSEHSRKKEPYTLLHGKQIIDLSKLKAKQRFVIPLFSEDEHERQNEIDADSLNIEESELVPFLTARIQFTKDKNLDTADPYRDVDISDKKLKLESTDQIVPEGNQYVWLRLKSDKKWTGFYQYQLLVTWRSRAPLETEAQGNKKLRKSGTGSVAPTAAGDTGVMRTVGDIVTGKWCCRRTHQVLTRVCITAEKYGRKETDLTFTPKEEVAFRTNKKARSVLLEQICMSRLENPSGSHLRDWLNRIWFLFVTGLDNDPSGSRVLSYEVRKVVHDAHFTEADAIILEACLLFSFVPSLKYETCQALAESDHQAVPWEKMIEGTQTAASQCRVSLAQYQFTHVFISFVGSLLDTLTEAEVVKAVTEFKPAIWDAHQRITKGAKSTIVFLKKQGRLPALKDNGINIDHLDALGRRKKAPKFV